MPITITYELGTRNTLTGVNTGYNRNTSTLANVSTATLQLWLQEALLAKQALMTGQQPLEISYAQGDGSKSVKRQATSLQFLNAWIQQLQLQLGQIQSARRPVRPNFR